MKVTYSIIAPIYNEIDNLPELYRRVKDGLFRGAMGINPCR
jgi:hypothetical protein